MCLSLLLFILYHIISIHGVYVRTFNTYLECLVRISTCFIKLYISIIYQQCEMNRSRLMPLVVYIHMHKLEV